MPSNPRVLVTIVGIVGVALFFLMGMGIVPGAGAVGVPVKNFPGGFTINPLAETSQTGLTTVFAVTGTVNGPGSAYTVQTANFIVNGAATPFLSANGTVTVPAVGSYSFSGTYVASVAGIYTLYAAMSITTTLTSGAIVTFHAVSPQFSFFVGATQPNSSGSPPSCGSTCPTASSLFTVGTTGLTATVRDRSVIANAATDSVSIGWGDGTSSSGVVGGTFTHTYSASGIDTVRDTVFVTNGTYNGSSSSSSTILVQSSTTTHGNGTAQGTNAAPSVSHFTPFVLAGMFASVGIIVMGVSGRWLEGGVLLVVLAAIGYAAGAMGGL